jgi:hypothetical protein
MPLHRSNTYAGHGSSSRGQQPPRPQEAPYQAYEGVPANDISFSNPFFSSRGSIRSHGDGPRFSRDPRNLYDERGDMFPAHREEERRGSRNEFTGERCSLQRTERVKIPLARPTSFSPSAAQAAREVQVNNAVASSRQESSSRHREESSSRRREEHPPTCGYPANPATGYLSSGLPSAGNPSTGYPFQEYPPVRRRSNLSRANAIRISPRRAASYGPSRPVPEYQLPDSPTLGYGSTGPLNLSRANAIRSPRAVAPSYGPRYAEVSDIHNVVGSGRSSSSSHREESHSSSSRSRSVRQAGGEKYESSARVDSAYSYEFTSGYSSSGNLSRSSSSRPLALPNVPPLTGAVYSRNWWQLKGESETTWIRYGRVDRKPEICQAPSIHSLRVVFDDARTEPAIPKEIRRVPVGGRSGDRAEAVIPK